MSSLLRTSSTVVREMKLKLETACPRNGIYPFTCSIPLGFLYIVLFVLNKKQTRWQNFMTKFQEIHLLKCDGKEILLYTFLYKRYYFVSHLTVNLEQNSRRVLQYTVMLRGHSSRFLVNDKSEFSEEILLEPSWQGKSLATIYFLFIYFKFDSEKVQTISVSQETYLLRCFITACCFVIIHDSVKWVKMLLALW